MQQHTPDYDNWWHPRPVEAPAETNFSPLSTKPRRRKHEPGWSKADLVFGLMFALILTVTAMVYF